MLRSIAARLSFSENQARAIVAKFGGTTPSLGPEDPAMAKKHNPKVPDFSSHKTQTRVPKGAKGEAPPPLAAHPAPAPAPVPKAHMPKTSGHRGA